MFYIQYFHVLHTNEECQCLTAVFSVFTFVPLLCIKWHNSANFSSSSLIFGRLQISYMTLIWSAGLTLFMEIFSSGSVMSFAKLGPTLVKKNIKLISHIFFAGDVNIPLH